MPTFFLTDWRHMSCKNTIEISLIYWNVLLWYFLINFLSRLGGLERLHGKTPSWQRGIPAVQKRDPVLRGWNVLHVIAGCNLWRVYNTTGIPTKRDRKVTDNTVFWKILNAKISGKSKYVLKLHLLKMIKSCPKMLKLPKLLMNIL